METTTTGPINPAHKLIDEERHNYMLEVIPPLWITHVDGKNVRQGFACSEAYTHSLNAVVLTVCYKHEGKYYETLCEIFKTDGTAIWDTYNHCYTRDNIAKTWIKAEN